MVKNKKYKFNPKEPIYKHTGNDDVIFKKLRTYVDTHRDGFLYKLLSPIKNYIADNYHKKDAFYFPEIRAVYYHSLKCGGTSVISTLKSKYDYNLMRKSKAVKLNCFNFTFVRNPYSRVVSGYNFLLPREIFNKKFKTNKKMKFDEFVKRICKISDRDSDSHFKSLSKHHQIKGKLDYLDFVGKLENIDNDFKKICKLIGIKEMKIQHKNKTKHEHWEEYYNKELKDLVYKRYKEDFDFGNYKK